MRINNEVYRMNHGKLPRGYGYWVFNIVGTDRLGNTIADTLVGIGHLRDARESACDQFNTLYEVKSITEVTTNP